MSRRSLLAIAVALAADRSPGRRGVGNVPAPDQGSGCTHRARRSRTGVRPRYGRGASHRRRSGSRFPAYWSIFERMSATASPKARFWLASTTASRARRSPERRLPSEQAAANLHKATASVEKARRTTPTPRTSANVVKSWWRAIPPRSRRRKRQKPVQDATLGELNLANGDVLVANAAIGDAKAQQQLQTADIGLSHSDGAVRRHGDRAIEGAWFGPQPRDNQCSL